MIKARAWASLMERLGYRRYGAVGNDWGSHISPELGRIAPDAVVGVHVTQLFSFPDGEWLSYPPGDEPDAEDLRQHPPAGPTTVPLALAQFPHDIHAIRACAERDHANITSWNSYDRGGHYAAHQAPDLLIQDIRTSLRWS